MRISLILAASLLAWIAQPSLSRACSFAGVSEFMPDPSLGDTVAPQPVGSVDVRVSRGHGPDCSGGRCQTDSCADLGTMGLTFTPPTDDRTASTDLAYRLEVAEGIPPEGLLPGFTFLPPFSPSEGIVLSWIDGDSDDQEPLEFSLRIYAVDQAGNESPATAIEVSDPGSSAGCNVGARGSALPLLLLPMGMIARRRFRRVR